MIANLIKSRQMLSEAFSKNPLVLANTVATSSVDTDFIVRLQEIIQANLSDPEFKINDIAEMVHMSRASFYRKIKGVLNMTPNDYLRLERLKTAARLLRDKRYHINEVCYMVGFSSTSYFAKCFQKQFGVLPKAIPGRRHIACLGTFELRPGSQTVLPGFVRTPHRIVRRRTR